MILALHSSFADPGAYAVDAGSPNGATVTVIGAQRVVSALATTDVATLGTPARNVPGAAADAQLFGPFVISYRAVDGAGNVAVVTRRVYVDTTCPSQERRCAGTAQCSEGGMCVPQLTTARPAATPYVPPVDTTPPRLTPRLRGADVVLESSSDGTPLVVESTVSVGAAFFDAGAVAHDNLDGNLTAQVSSLGLRSVTTGAPTRERAPFVVRYRIADAAGNVAEAARLVAVQCPPPERTCVPADGAQLFCSTERICAVPARRPEGEPALPVLTLRGPAEAYVTAGALYTSCPHPAPVDLVCDRVRVSALRELVAPLLIVRLVTHMRKVSYVQACCAVAAHSRHHIAA